MHSQHRPLLALGLRLLAMVAMSVTLVCSRLSGELGIALTEALFWRQLLPMLAILAWLTARGELARLRTDRFWIHARRAVIGTVGMFMTLGVARMMPLAEATIMGFTAPIFSVILATVLLRESVGPWRWGAVLLGLVGVLVIVGPNRTHLPLDGVAVGLGAAFAIALVSIQLRDLGRTEEPLKVVFYFSALSALMLLPGAVITAQPHSPDGWLVLGGLGLSGLCTQFLITASLRFGSVSSVIVMDYSQLIWTTLWGVLLFGQFPPTTTWIGAPLVIAAGLTIAWREHRLHRRTAIEPSLTPNGD